MGQQVGGQDVSRETYAELQAFAAMVEKWTPHINLISKASVNDLWERHIVDSAQLYRFSPSKFQTWVDFGSGGGFPGIVVACLGKAFQPGAHFTLIESDQRKVSFLKTVVRELSLPASIIARRIEEVEPLGADIVSARALTALSTLLPLIERHLKPSGLALLHKGRRFGEEVAEARRSWSFELDEYPSMTNSEARLLSVKRIHHDPTYST